MSNLNLKKHLSVAGIVFSEDRAKVLLIKRRDVSIWVLPGGGVDLNETPDVAVIREIEEETGLKTEIKRPIAIYTPINRLTHKTYTFECQVMSGATKISNETLGVSFFPLDKLPVPFFYIHKKWIDHALQNHPETIHEPFSDVTYYNLFKYFISHPVQVIRMALSRYLIPYNTK